MLCMFMKNRRKFQWLTGLVPAMPLYNVPEQPQQSSDDDWYSLDHDIPNAEHIEREYGVTQLQRIKAFQRMAVYGAVDKDVSRHMWKTIPKAMDAIAAYWVRLRAQDVWDEAHPQTLGSVQSEAKRNNKTIHIGPFSISALKNIANSLVVCANTKGA